MDIEVQLGLIPNNTWGEMLEAKHGAGIKRVAPRLIYDNPGLSGHPSWKRAGTVYQLDLELQTYDTTKTFSLEELASQLRNSKSTNHRALECLDFAADTLLKYLHRLVEAQKSVGLIAPPNFVVVLRDNVDFLKATNLRKDAIANGKKFLDLNEDDQNLVRRAGVGRFLFMPDLGFRSPPQSSGQASWLAEDQPFAFIWDDPPTIEHESVMGPERVNRTVARMFTWILTGRSMKNLPAVTSNERMLAGPCWDVLWKATEGVYQSVEEFRQNLERAPLSTFRHGLPESSAGAATLSEGSKQSSKGSKGVLIGMLVILAIVGGFLALAFMWPQGGDAEIALTCCPEITNETGEKFFSLASQYDVLYGIRTKISEVTSRDDLDTFLRNVTSQLSSMNELLDVVYELVDEENNDGKSAADKQRQSDCAKKMIGDLIREMLELSTIYRKSSHNLAISQWESREQVKMFDQVGSKLISLRPFSDPESAKGLGQLRIDIEGFVIVTRGIEPTHQWQIDRIKQ